MLFGILVSSALSSCASPLALSPTASKDILRAELLDDQLSESDLFHLAERVVKEIELCAEFVNARAPRSVAIGRLVDQTEEHVDTVALTDRVLTALKQSGDVRVARDPHYDFVEEAGRYQESELDQEPTSKKEARPSRVDFRLEGALLKGPVQVGNDRFVQYKLTLKLKRPETGAIACTPSVEVRKVFKKARSS